MTQAAYPGKKSKETSAFAYPALVIKKIKVLLSSKKKNVLSQLQPPAKLKKLQQTYKRAPDRILQTLHVRYCGSSK